MEPQLQHHLSLRGKESMGRRRWLPTPRGGQARSNQVSGTDVLCTVIKHIRAAWTCPLHGQQGACRLL